MAQEVPTEDGIRGVRPGKAPAVLSVLDLATVGRGSSATEALRATTELARLAEQLGFHRFWVAEHHSMPGIASSSPAVLLGHLAAQTERIRLGSGGVMLPNHAPLVVAEQFGTLQALAPGRVDLGLGRAPGTDQATAAALRRGRTDGADAFPQQLAELVRFLDDDFPEGHPYTRIHAVPGPVQSATSGGVPGPGRPTVWLLGSSGFSAELAGRLGLPFAFANHFSAANTIPALELYRSSFRPSAVLQEPYTLIGVSALAADEERAALREVMTGALAMLQLRTGRPGLVPSAEEAEAYPYTRVETEFLDSWLANVVHGTGPTVRSGLNALVERTGADELMITSNSHDPKARLRSLQILAEVFEMG